MKVLGILICTLLISVAANGQSTTKHFGDTKYPYYLHLPADSILENKPPVILFLHGKSLSGSNLENLKKYGIISEILKGKTLNSIVIAPQTNNGWTPSLIKEVVDKVRSQFNTDTTRFYVVGMSMGGYGTINFVGSYHKIVAAAIAMCGGGDIKYGENLSKVPMWIRHGDRDYVVPLSESQKIVNAIKKYDASKLTFTIDKGLNHGDMERFFRTTELYEWLFKHQLSN